VKLEDIAGGVRVTFAAGAPIEAIVHHMRCHFAYAQTNGFSDAASCPLYIKGIRIEQGPGKQIVDITSASNDPSVVKQVRARSRQEIKFDSTVSQ
jgi:hypothetical protein